MLVVSLLLAYLSPYFDPNEYSIFSMFGLIYPVFLLANIVLVLFWLLVDFKYLFLSLITILLGWTHLKGFVNFSTLSDDPGDISIMSYNVRNFYSERLGSKKKKAANLGMIKSFFTDHSDVDIFCLQEADYFSKDILRDLFPKYHHHAIPNIRTFIISRYPIIDKGKIDFGTATNSCIWTDLQLPSEKIRIYTMHLQSNKVSKDAVDVMDNVNLQEKETWNGIRGILNKYSKTSKTRATQAQKIADHATKSPHKTIICGDVNDPPTSYTYSRLCGDYQDSFVKAGAGIGTTYAGKIPMLRIDYIFADQNFNVESFEVLNENFSDHYPVKGIYSFKEN